MKRLINLYCISNFLQVSLLYKGVLAKNKKQFDAKLNPKSPFTFVLGKGTVIRGWDMGVAGRAPISTLRKQSYSRK